MISLNRIAQILLILAFMLPIFHRAFCQENPFDSSLEQNHETDFWNSSEYIRNLKVNEDNMSFFTTNYNTNGMASSSHSIKLYFFDEHNSVQNRTLLSSTANMNPYTNSYFEFALFDDGIAYPSLQGESFKWLFYGTDNHDMVSDSLVLPSNSCTILGICQINNTQCLVLFKDVSTSQCHAYYLDINANPIWNFSFDLSLINQSSFSFSDLVMIDENHFVVGLTNANGLYKLLEMDNLGAVTSNTAFLAGTTTLLKRTSVPARLIISSYRLGSILITQYENHIVSPILNIPHTAPLTKVPVVADSTGITVLLGLVASSLELKKYNWNGSLLWSNTLALNSFNAMKPEWMDISPAGSIVLCFLTRFWSLGYFDTQPYYYWHYYYDFGRIVSNGNMTNINDNTVIPVQNTFSSYPNPFKTQVTFGFEMKSRQTVIVNIYNLKGQLVRQINIGVAKQGQSKVNWDGKDSLGHSISTGMYFAKVDSDEVHIVRKIVKID